MTNPLSDPCEYGSEKKGDCANQEGGAVDDFQTDETLETKEGSQSLTRWLAYWGIGGEYED